MKERQKDWLKFKPYTHITPKTNWSDQSWIRAYVKDEAKVKTHRFYPFLHYTKVDNKFTRQRSGRKKEGIRKPKTKKREIFYANHLDNHLLAFYGKGLTDRLNQIYDSNPELGESVIAYRAIELNRHRNKCNIDFANEAFSYIKNSKAIELSATCLDVSSYFDTIDHKILKRGWINLLNDTGDNKCADLPIHQYKVFKAVTKFCYIEISDAIALSPGTNVKKLSNLSRSDIDSFFESGSEFNRIISNQGVLRRNFNNYGIPQGSAISAVLSNLYLLEFDTAMVKLAKLYKGLYRRYSDDIIFICDPQWINLVSTYAKIYLTEKLKLTIQDSKTQRVDFNRHNDLDNWKTSLIEQGEKYIGRPLTYLGFDFDGKNIRIKNKSISGYYRKTKRLVRRAAVFAFKTKRLIRNHKEIDGDPWLYRTRIYKSKSHLGAKRKSIGNRVFWGNYLSYVYNASRIMDEPGIKRQLRNHWRILEKEIEKNNSKYQLNKSVPKRMK